MNFLLSLAAACIIAAQPTVGAPGAGEKCCNLLARLRTAVDEFP
jgi:hypothetical protein